MLVYEFVQNKTLEVFLDLQKSKKFHVTLGTHMRIAAQSAEALAHLHSLPHPIIHGDVKLANILFVEGLVAKMSDFGCSTSGYIDPDYLLEYQLTSKNDIYSFGIILLELQLKPLSKDRKSLTLMFQEAMAEGTLFELLDSDTVDEASTRVMHQVAVLASQWLVVPGMTRPTMALVAAELRRLALVDEVQQCPQPPLVLEDLSFEEMGSTTSGVYSLEKKAVLSIGSRDDLQIICCIHFQKLAVAAIFLVSLGHAALLAAVGALAAPPPPPPGSSNCSTACGGVDIPYPFGIGPGCALPGFELTCRDTNNGGKGKKPFLWHGHFELAGVSKPDGQARVWSNISSYCNDTATNSKTIMDVVNFADPYRLSQAGNTFTVVGCQAVAVVGVGDSVDNIVRFLSGCVATNCGRRGDRLADGACSGAGCCQTTITNGYNAYQVQFTDYPTVFNTTKEINNVSRCSYAALMESSSFSFRKSYVTSSEFFDANGGQVPMVVEWAVRNASNCVEAQKNRESYACVSLNSACVNSSNGPGYICNCAKGFEGNPYLPIGCQDIDECKEPKIYPCYGNCKNKGILTVHVLQRAMLGSPSMRESRSKTATNNFNKAHIIGGGAVIDGTIVTIKRCKEIDESKKIDFVQELVILCRVNHTNIVRLLGCCLQFEAPMLVYEFVQNKTLQELLDLQRSKRFHVTLGTRLRIAAESADAFAHLHSLPRPILHGDVKPANILLAEGLVAKVSNFGCSTIDEKTQVVPKGTPGYIDPDYLLEYQLTTSNDVYSFGVILLELLTSGRPFSNERKSLTSMFQEAMANDTLVELLDSDIVDGTSMRVIHQAAVLANQCLVVPGTTRPTMMLVAAELRQLALADEVQQCPQPPLVLEDLSFIGMGRTSMSTWFGGSNTSGVYGLQKKAMLSLECVRDRDFIRSSRVEELECQNNSESCDDDKN
uniref:Protein kinase domain-containing protein n=1 Tax=Oryza punctata TaxID=4537 RepID=A0A0E0KPG3_ORYPU